MDTNQITIRSYPSHLHLIPENGEVPALTKKYQLICVGSSNLVAVTAYVVLKPYEEAERPVATPGLLNQHPLICWKKNNRGEQVLAYSLHIYARPGNHSLIGKAFGQQKAAIETLDIASRPSAQIELLGAKHLQISAKSILPYLSKTPTIVADDKIRLSALVLPFYVIPDFATHMLAYYEDPDDSVKVITHADDVADAFADLAEAYGCKEEAKLVWAANNGVEGMPLPKPAIRTKAEQMAFGYMLAFCMVKSGGDYVATALKRRLESYANILRDPGFDFEEFVNTFYDQAILQNATRQINFFPRLKSAIYSAIVTTQSESCVHFRTILEGVQMTKFNFIYAFLYHPSSITALHFNREVARYYPKFIEVYKSLVEKYGDLWQYHKLICPGEPLTNLSQFGKLVQAGMAFAATRPGNGGRIKNVQGYNEIPGSYFVMVTEEVGTADSARCARYAEVVEMLKEINEEFRLNEGVTEVTINEKISESADAVKINNVKAQFAL